MLIPAQRGAPTLPAGEDPGSSGPLHPLPRTVVPLAAGPLHPAAPQGAAPGREEAAAGALPRLAEHVGRDGGRCTTASFTARRRPRGRHQSPAALGLSACAARPDLRPSLVSVQVRGAGTPAASSWAVGTSRACSALGAPTGARSRSSGTQRTGARGEAPSDACWRVGWAPATSAGRAGPDQGGRMSGPACPRVARLRLPSQNPGARAGAAGLSGETGSGSHGPGYLSAVCPPLRAGGHAAFPVRISACMQRLKKAAWTRIVGVAGLGRRRMRAAAAGGRHWGPQPHLECERSLELSRPRGRGEGGCQKTVPECSPRTPNKPMGLARPQDGHSNDRLQRSRQRGSACGTVC